jgi:serine/threonine-protein kinase HipA
MADFEVHIGMNGRIRRVGLARSNRVRGNETVAFKYAPEWLVDPNRFSIEPALGLMRGGFAPAPGQASFRSIGDSAPDTWGRRLMQRAERRLAEREGPAICTLTESDLLASTQEESQAPKDFALWFGEKYGLTLLSEFKATWGRG